MCVDHVLSKNTTNVPLSAAPLLWLTLLLSLLTLALAGCSRETSDAGPRAAAAVAAIALQSDEYRSQRPAGAVPAPVELDYQMPAAAPGDQPLLVELTLRTPLHSGDMMVSVVEQIGVALQGEAVRHIDLASAARPLLLALPVIPVAVIPVALEPAAPVSRGSEQRSLLLVISVEVEAVRQSRSFRIYLPAPLAN